MVIKWLYTLLTCRCVPYLSMMVCCPSFHAQSVHECVAAFPVTLLLCAVSCQWDYFPIITSFFLNMLIGRRSLFGVRRYLSQLTFNVCLAGGLVEYTLSGSTQCDNCECMCASLLFLVGYMILRSSTVLLSGHSIIQGALTSGRGTGPCYPCCMLTPKIAVSFDHNYLVCVWCGCMCFGVDACVLVWMHVFWWGCMCFGGDACVLVGMHVFWWGCIWRYESARM